MLMRLIMMRMRRNNHFCVFAGQDSRDVFGVFCIFYLKMLKSTENDDDNADDDAHDDADDDADVTANSRNAPHWPPTHSLISTVKQNLDFQPSRGA